ncbi:hypothetical protein D9615_009613 [Tricholomella constricta]|uniref:Uncharacterized protein n=1 Tax=Tricholomella constricta TaxID=117010 RepID=A0A8H5LW23_9AGAR|nr:hypothetical protein D9615_009613 [Tricholomella constricta]
MNLNLALSSLWRTPPSPAAASTSGSQLQLQTQAIPMHGAVRTMNKRRYFEPDIHHPYRCQPSAAAASAASKHALPSLTIPGAAANPVMAFLDVTFRNYAERIQAELAHLRTACTKAVFREQQEKDTWKAHCMALKQERDMARERVRALMEEKRREEEEEVGKDRGGSEPRRSLREIRRSRSGGPFVTPTRRSPPLRASRSASPLLSSSSWTSSDATAVSGDGAATQPIDGFGGEPSKNTAPLPPSSSSSFSSSSSSGTAVWTIDNEPILWDPAFAYAYPDPASPPKLSPLQEELTSLAALPSAPPFESSSFPDHHAATHATSPLKRSQSAGPVLSRLPDRAPAPNSSSTPTLSPSPSQSSPPASPSPSTPSRTRTRTRTHTTPPTPPPLGSAAPAPTRAALLQHLPSPSQCSLKLKVDHFDVMFVPVKGELRCRVCSMVQSKNRDRDGKSPSPASSPASQAQSPAPIPVPGTSTGTFALTASWDTLFTHAWTQHPTEAAEVARLHPARVLELRRRLRHLSTVLAPDTSPPIS